MGEGLASLRFVMEFLKGGTRIDGFNPFMFLINLNGKVGILLQVASHTHACIHTLRLKKEKYA